jgi:ParB/RepB/Spo0J family partition protein
VLTEENEESKMSVQFISAHTRTSEYLFFPEDVIIRPELNGRHILPNIDWLKQDILSRGQLQPVLVRSDGGKPVLVAGFSRWRAISEINHDRSDGDKLKLRAVYFKGNEADGFMANLAENKVRKDPQPIDDAYNIARLERYGRTLPEIAAFYGETEAWVKDRLALVNLCQEAQNKVAEGKLKVSAAVAISKLAEKLQKEKIASGKKLTAAGIKAEATGKTPKPTLGQVVKILRAVVDEGTYPDGFEFVRSKDPINDTLAEFCSVVLKIIEGK